MNRKNFLLMALVVVFALLPALSGWAAPGGQGNLLRKWWRNDRFAARLRLTAEQKRKLDDLYAGHRVEFIELRAEVEKSTARLEQTMDAKHFSEAEARERLAAARRAKDRLDKARMDYLLEVRGILTREQFMKLKKVTEERRQRQHR